jgi:uncharacterized protein (TIGR03435 family)
MPEFAWGLTTLVDLQDRIAVDRTGLDGHYDFELRYASDGPSPMTGDPPLFVALREQLGLKLEARKILLEAIRVEYAEMPAAN